MAIESKWRSIPVGVAVGGVLAGLVGGYFAAHMMMGGMAGMTTEKGAISAPPAREGEKEGVKEMDMKGMAPASPGAVAIPAVMRQLIGVRSVPAAVVPLTQEIRTVGSVDYDERGYSQVTLKVSGWVRQVFVDSVGRSVRKGEPLLTLYAPDLLATQDEYLLALKMKAQLADSPLGEAQENAVALVASARERLRLLDLTDAQVVALERRGKPEPILTVFAPASGIVLKREAVPGKYVEPGTTLYELADLSTVWVSADIYESEVAAVEVNQPASVEFAAYPGETFRAKVTYILPSVNEAARTVRVRLELPNPVLKLKPGMYGTITVRTESAKALVVPKEAVLDTGLRQLVYLDRGQGVYQPYPVKLGRRSQDLVEVLDGVKEGDRVVTSANFLVDAESKLASSGGMQEMMGRVGMADWQMRGAYEAKMDDMKNMKGMPGMNAPTAAGPVNETRQSGEVSLTLTTMPEKLKAGENVLRVKLADKAGKAIANAQVVFIYTMPMPGMTDTKAPAIYKGGVYEGKAMLGMNGTWDVTVHVTIPGRPPIKEKFSLQVGGGMSGKAGVSAPAGRVGEKA